ncbi:MAG: hypothetical protein R3E79_27730 [Caldilineaceae bacterium]
MKSRTKQRLALAVIALLAVFVYTGSVFAQNDTTATTTPAPNMLQRVQERLGPEGWGQMVQRMTQRFGAEFTGQMLQRMAQQENCPCLPDETCEPGMGQGMMQQGRMGQDTMQQGRRGMSGGMMGRGMWGRNTTQRGFNHQMVPRFWDSTPTAIPTEAPTATPAE